MSNHRDRILPPYASSLGKAIAAFQTSARARVLLDVYGIYPFTSHTLTDAAAIHEELGKIRERGFAEDREETVVGGHCFGAPVRDLNGEVIAAISVSLPVGR
jgi:DNA-binding IclR family transcriptional regulator